MSLSRETLREIIPELNRIRFESNEMSRARQRQRSPPLPCCANNRKASCLSMGQGCPSPGFICKWILGRDESVEGPEPHFKDNNRKMQFVTQLVKQWDLSVTKNSESSKPSSGLWEAAVRLFHSLTLFLFYSYSVIQTTELKQNSLFSKGNWIFESWVPKVKIIASVLGSLCDDLKHFYKCMMCELLYEIQKNCIKYFTYTIG